VGANQERDKAGRANFTVVAAEIDVAARGDVGLHKLDIAWGLTHEVTGGSECKIRFNAAATWRFSETCS
jgi:hypothetical protein